MSFVSRLAMCLALAGASYVLPAAAVVVNIDAAVTGCDFNHCSGQHVPAGTTVDSVIKPVQVQFAAGTYNVTNANGMQGADPNFTAWRFDGGNDWVWSFMIIDDATKKVVVEGCCMNSQVPYATQAGAANDPFALNYFSSFTLSTDTTLDFVTEDYYAPDNGGGVALNILAANAPPPSMNTPEPATLALFGAGTALAAVARRRAKA